MAERNLCTESGCMGFCCGNIDLIVTKCERTRLFPKAIQVTTFREMIALKEKGGNGQFYIEYSDKKLKGDFYLLSIAGNCPNRTESGACSKHEEREYAARNFKIGSPECNQIRAEHKLPPI